MISRFYIHHNNFYFYICLSGLNIKTTKSTKSEHIFYINEIILRKFISSTVLPTLPLKNTLAGIQTTLGIGDISLSIG